MHFEITVNLVITWEGQCEILLAFLVCLKFLKELHKQALPISSKGLFSRWSKKQKKNCTSDE